MRVQPLTAAGSARLHPLHLSYPDVGASIQGRTPPGFRGLSRTIPLPTGSDLDVAAQALLTWQVQLRAGIRVSTDGPRVEIGADALLRIGFGRLSLPAPVRIVEVVEESDRRGFAYGTLTGHPESGEELFLLERGRNGEVTFCVRAFSRAAGRFTRISGPVGRAVQRGITNRYLHAFDGPSAATA